MYERFFGLVDAPFRLTPDPRYLFLSKKHADALAHLRLGLAESSGFVCITGDVGAGKTTLLRAFLANLLPEITTAYIFNPALSALELLQTINGEFGIRADTDSKKELVDALNRHLLAQRAADRRSVVVIDEAQALSVDVLEQLRLLSNLETATDKLLRIVLVGQPQLRALLLHPGLVQLNQRITLRWHLGPLDARETAAYVRHRLAIASRGQAGRMFTRPAVWLVYRHSGGVPRLINMLAHRAMLAAFAAESRVVSARHVGRAQREIASVPLPVVPVPPGRRASWAAVGVGASLGVIALAAGRFAGELVPPARDTAAVSPPAVEASLAPPAAAAAPAEGPGPEAKPAAIEPPLAPAAAAPAAPSEDPAPTVTERLVATDAAASARAAVAAVLAAWDAPDLAPEEGAAPENLTAVARRRGLEYLPLVGNVGMLRLLDLPVVLALHLPGTDGVRYAALTGLVGGRARLVVDGAAAVVEPAFLDGHWLGQAHILWRDFEGLGPVTLGAEAHGEPVRRLQALLARAGVYGGPQTGAFDKPTAAAVLAFQRSRLLHPDARVGRLTRIVLYAAAGGYPRPTLAPPAGGTS
jgi:general secretion pathway protein A